MPPQSVAPAAAASDDKPDLLGRFAAWSREVGDDIAAASSEASTKASAAWSDVSSDRRFTAAELKLSAAQRSVRGLVLERIKGLTLSEAEAARRAATMAKIQQLDGAAAQVEQLLEMAAALVAARAEAGALVDKVGRGLAAAAASPDGVQTEAMSAFSGVAARATGAADALRAELVSPLEKTETELGFARSTVGLYLDEQVCFDERQADMQKLEKQLDGGGTVEGHGDAIAALNAAEAAYNKAEASALAVIASALENAGLSTAAALKAFAEQHEAQAKADATSMEALLALLKQPVAASF